jgi:hypothetical protein
MQDLLYLGLTVAFFAACWALVGFLGRLEPKP